MINSKNRMTKVEELRKQLEEAEKEQKAQDKANVLAMRRAKKAAGDSHTRLALSLYDLLEVKPEHPTTRITDGETKSVAVDKDETLRSQRLVEMITTIIDKADPSLLNQLKRTDREGRDERKPTVKKAGAERPKSDNDAPRAWPLDGGADSAPSKPAPTVPSPTDGGPQESQARQHQPA